MESQRETIKTIRISEKQIKHMLLIRVKAALKPFVSRTMKS